MNTSSVIARALFWSLFISLLLCVLQVARFSDSSFMGTNSNAFALEVLKFYPFTAMGELAKIIASCCIPLFFVCFAILQKKQLRPRILLFVLFSLSYFCFFWGSVLRYPALYQDFFSLKTNSFLFRISTYLSPSALQIVAMMFFFAAFLLMERAVRKILGSIFVGLLLVFLGNTLLSKNSIPGSPKANVILIGIDSFRSDHLRADLVPNISALKAEPATSSFNDHIIGIPRTFPSWMEILSGRYSAQTGIRHMFPGLLEQRKFSSGLVSTLRGAGYSTSVVSDFAGDIFPRFNAGFDDVGTPNFTLQALTRMTIAQSFPLVLPLITSSLLKRFFPDLLENPCFSDPDDLVTKSIERIKEAKGPLFLSIFFSSAHFPYAAPWPWYSKYSKPDYKGPYFFKKDPDLSQSHSVSEEDIAQIRSLYSGSLSSIDAALGRFFRYLKDQNLWDNSIIVITADHGEDLFEFDMVQGHGEHIRGENVLKVPFLLKFPKQDVLQNRDISFTSRMIDLAPTVAGILNLKLEGASGLDLNPWVKDSRLAPPDTSAYSETEIWFSRTGNAFFQKERLDYPGISSLLNLDPGGTGAIVLNPNYEKIIITAKHRSMIKGRYKLIYTPTSNGAFFKLFDRVLDPQNIHDISQTDPSRFRLMKDMLVKQVLNLESHSKFIDSYVVPF